MSLNLTIKNKFGIEQFVYLKTDPDKLRHLIVYIKVTPAGLLYGLAYGGECTEHYQIELELSDQQ